MGQVVYPKTSVSNYLTPRNNPEDGIIQEANCFETGDEI
jgi:hypothetical protein